MGLFNKHKTSPSGFFNAEPTSSDEESHNRENKYTADRKRRSSRSTASPRASTDTSSSATEKVEDKVEDKTGSPAAAGAAGAAAGTAVEKKRERDGEHESKVPLTAAGSGEGKHSSAIEGDNNAVEPLGTSAPTSSSTTGVNRKAVPVDSTLASSTASAGSAGSADVHAHQVSKPPVHRHHGLSKDAVLSVEDAKRAEHDHQYLEPVVHERHHIHEIEEVERHRVVDRHVHHTQHHVQPLIDERHLEVVHSFREVPVTHIQESHAATPADAALLARLNAQSASTYTVVPHERVRIDKGETQVVENVINHYHVIVQPVWQRDLHEYYRLQSDFSLPATNTATTASTTAGAGIAPQLNTASPAVQSGRAGAVGLEPSGTASAGVVPTNLAAFGHGFTVPKGYKLVPDLEGPTYEVEYVNREPVVPGRNVAVAEGLPTTHTSATYGGAAPSAKEHYAAGSQGVAVREATGLTGTHGTHSHAHHHSAAGTGATNGLERGVEELRLGVAK
ncbi:hypothetical protein JCM8097_006706 [Rhodosporidiobolus ruineniae]